MTTSPFGTPTASPEPADRPEASPPRSRRPLVLGLLGAGVAVAVGAGAFVLLSGGGEEPAAVAAPSTPARGTDTVVPETPETAEAELVTVGSRNPFAAQVVAGGGGASASAPVMTTPSSGGTSTTTVSGGSSSGGSSSGGGVSISIPGERGPAGKDGKNGRNGTDGTDGADGLTPSWLTLTLRDVVDDATPTPTATFTVRDATGEDTAAGYGVDDVVGQVGTVSPTDVIVRSFTDLDSDGEIDYAAVQLGEDGATYSVWIGEALPLFGY